MAWEAFISEAVLARPVEGGSYLSSLPAVRFLSRRQALEFTSPVTFFVGENGTGKSTLLEAIAVACGFNAEGGGKNFCFSTARTHSELYKHLRLIKRRFPKDGYFLRAESLYNVASNIDELDRIPAACGPLIGGYGGVSLHQQSHGESFLALVQNRFGGNGLYLLDEPEAALSPMRQLTLIAELHGLVRRGSQLIIATHSPILMAFPGALIYEFSAEGIAPVQYRDTQHYQITRRFLENPEKMLQVLLEDDTKKPRD